MTLMSQIEICDGDSNAPAVVEATKVRIPPAPTTATDRNRAVARRAMPKGIGACARAPQRPLMTPRL
ncbi:hypothetical protein M885DRAFT_531301 [Pelagophyceae sp. CCMP2097]|nr:hypothetical protein M885DRAFT_531301 [Pelagophyceae sp. CCMP2097]